MVTYLYPLEQGYRRQRHVDLYTQGIHFGCCNGFLLLVLYWYNNRSTRIIIQNKHQKVRNYN